MSGYVLGSAIGQRNLQKVSIYWIARVGVQELDESPVRSHSAIGQPPTCATSVCLTRDAHTLHGSWPGVCDLPSASLCRCVFHTSPASTPAPTSLWLSRYRHTLVFVLPLHTEWHLNTATQQTGQGFHYHSKEIPAMNDTIQAGSEDIVLFLISAKINNNTTKRCLWS